MMPKEQYMCQLCANHGQYNQPKKGHKQNCPNRNCYCSLCSLNSKRRLLDQIERQWRSGANPDTNDEENDDVRNSVEDDWSTISQINNSTKTSKNAKEDLLRSPKKKAETLVAGRVTVFGRTGPKCTVFGRTGPNSIGLPSIPYGCNTYSKNQNALSGYCNRQDSRLLKTHKNIARNSNFHSVDLLLSQ